MDMLLSRIIWIKANWKLQKAPPITVVDNEKHNHVYAERKMIKEKLGKLD